MCSVRSADGTVDTESYEVSPIVASDARGGEKAMVVPDGDTVPTQWTVVGAGWYGHLAINAVFPVTAGQRAIGNAVAETVALPHEQKIAEYLQHSKLICV